MYILLIINTYKSIFHKLFFIESVKALLGKHVKILLKNVVKLETKQDKQENRVLVSNKILEHCDIKL